MLSLDQSSLFAIFLLSLITMAKDKELTHIKILEVAKEEFIKNGFLNTSIRDIAKKAGVTSAALYRHAQNKEDLFCQIVSPFVKAFEKSKREHVSQKSSQIQSNADSETIKNGSGLNLVVLLPYRTEVKLILNNAKGTKYENFLHNHIEEDVQSMQGALELLRKQGKNAAVLTNQELHIFVSAFYTAALEPILHDYSDDEVKRCFNLATDFFMPGWLKFMGY